MRCLVRFYALTKTEKFIEAIVKIRIFVRDQGEAECNPAGILKYVEDVTQGLNAETCPPWRIGRKDFFR